MQQKDYLRFLSDLANKKLTSDEKWNNILTEHTSEMGFFLEDDSSAYRIKVTYRTYGYEVDKEPEFVRAVLIDDELEENEVYELTKDEFTAVLDILGSHY